MSRLQIEDCYQPPSGPIGTNNTVIVKLDPQVTLQVVNLTEAGTLLQKSFTTDNVLSCAGMFDLEIRIQLGALQMGQQKISSGNWFKSSSLARYDVRLLDESTGQEERMLLEHYLPSFYPFIQMGIRITVGGEMVFEQGKIPETFWSLGKSIYKNSGY